MTVVRHLRFLIACEDTKDAEILPSSSHMEGLNMDQLIELRVFITLAKLKSFRKTADSLGMACSTVSRAISDLEGRTRMRLFNRTTRSVILTDAARKYYECCASILEQLDEAESHIVSETHESTGTLNLLVHPVLAAGDLVRLLGGYKELAPCVNVNITLSDKRIDFMTETYDVAIVPPEMVTTTSAVSRTLAMSSRILVASPAYLQAHGPIHHAIDLQEHTLLHPPDSNVETSRKIALFDGMQSMEIEPLTSIFCNELLLSACALAGLGVAAMSARSVEADLAAGRLEQVLPEYEMHNADVRLCLIYPSRHLVPARCRVFIDYAMHLLRPNVETTLDPVNQNFQLAKAMYASELPQENCAV